MSIYLPPVAASCRRVVQINYPQKQLLIVTLLRVWTSSHHDALSHFCPLATPSPWQRAHLFLSLPHEQAVNTTDTAHASIPYRSRPCDDDRSQAHQPIAGPPTPSVAGRSTNANVLHVDRRRAASMQSGRLTRRRRARNSKLMDFISRRDGLRVASIGTTGAERRHDQGAAID